jgi:hypothetical protein
LEGTIKIIIRDIKKSNRKKVILRYTASTIINPYGKTRSNITRSPIMCKGHLLLEFAHVHDQSLQ